MGHLARIILTILAVVVCLPLCAVTQGTARSEPPCVRDRYSPVENTLMNGAGPSPRPLGMTNKSLGGWSWRWLRSPDGTWEYKWLQRGLSTFGLLVRTWGQVTEIDPSGNWFYVDDGSHLRDYAENHIGVRVTSGPGSLSVGDHVTVTGVNSMFADPTTGDPLPNIRVRASSDIHKS